MIKLIAFDWNGTLIADTKVVVKATNIAFKHFGYPKISIETYRNTFVIPVIKFWLANGGKPKDMAQEHHVFFPNYEKLLKEAHTRPNAARILNWIHGQGIRSIIYSNHTFKEIHKQLKRFKLNKYIDVVLSRKDKDDHTHLHKRHKEDKLADYIKSNRFKPEEVISVGDTCEEVEIGHKLGLHTVAITGGENSTNRIVKAKPDFLIRNLNQLPGIIKKLNR